MRWTGLIVACGMLAGPVSAVEAQATFARWHTTLDSAREAARSSGKPLFIVFRCVPCADCRKWDVLVAEKDPQIAEAREGFVCARIPQMNGVDIGRFEHDFDTNWTGYFTDADLNIYSRYGGRDETEADARLSQSSLLTTMREVLAVHQDRSKRGAAAGDALHPEPTISTTPDDIPLLKEKHRGCIHCHQIQEYRLRQAYVDGKFNQKMLLGFPLPENLGMHLDLSHGHKLQKTGDGSAAARAGLLPGDVVVRVNDVPVRSEQDIRWALHRADEVSPVVVTVQREQVAESVTVRLDVRDFKDWKQTPLGWRKSLSSVPLALGFLGYGLSDDDLKELGLPVKRLAIRVIFLRGPGLAEGIGLQKDDLIMGVDGQTEPRTFDEFKSDLLCRYKPGSPLTLTVRRGTTMHELRGQLPDWFLDLSTVP